MVSKQVQVSFLITFFYIITKHFDTKVSPKELFYCATQFSFISLKCLSFTFSTFSKSPLKLVVSHLGFLCNLFFWICSSSPKCLLFSFLLTSCFIENFLSSKGCFRHLRNSSTIKEKTFSIFRRFEG